MTRPSGGRRRRLVWIVPVVVALLLAAGAVKVLTGGPGDVSNSDVEFDTAPPTAPTPTTPAPKTTTSSAKDPFADGFEWPVYGYTQNRARYLPLERNLRPPFNVRWKVTGSILLEFPPVICGKSLYLLKNNGALYAISRRTGHVRWKVKLGYLAASSPACSHGTVYAVMLSRGKGIRAGRIAAIAGYTGRTRWSRKLPSRAESSPLLDHGRLYFGSEDGTVYAMDAANGDIQWTYKAGGAVKGALALDDDGRLIFGDYGGHVTAIRRADGKQLWQTGTSGGAFGLKSGNFYATAAIAYGRVYIGNTDGFVYSFSARDGKLAWRHKTGGYVYSSPAISPVLGGTVYAGSYDGKLYAFDARTGSVRWTHKSGGKISGGPVVIGDLVFYSNLTKHSTGAVGAATGHAVWSIGRGAFNPVISDGQRIYLVGYATLYALGEEGRTAEGTLTAAGRKQRRAHLSAVAERRHRRYVDRRVLERKRAVARRLAARRKGLEVCFRSSGKTKCRVPKPPVCFTRKSDGRTICRARKA
ncbi:beta-propeller repeat protein [Baekduia alba]|uniref:outer membrane protein assembly factor BamB family protein n=1 Tax=Baekduia alba TaxID=2997333 RepID=UPI00233FF916|nr:PQQ-binding-like beta-propeller repeat protein [Baekduia alba]WCB93929.1 beta-propeller repeat protein [Baekduia alba]